MNWDNFYEFLELFKKYNVVPLLGVVPDNKDPNLSVAEKEDRFWEIIKKLCEEGTVEISQHGYRHLYTTKKIQLFYRICGFQTQSEFYGIGYKKQYEMIKKGKEIINKHGIDVDIWMAPAHSYDKNTVKALKALGFKAATDGIGLFPVKRGGIMFVPQQVWCPEKSRMGVKTICLHLNNANGELYKKVENHLKSDRNIVSFSSVLDYKTSVHHYIINHLYKAVFVLKLVKHGIRRWIR